MSGALDPARRVRLRRGTIGPWGLAVLALGILSPAIGLYALWPPIQEQAGPIAPLVYVAAMVMALPTALSYAVLNAEAPSAGAGASWLWQAGAPAFGYLIGLTMAAFFLLGAIGQPLLFLAFAHELATAMGLRPDQTLFPLGCVAVGTATVLAITRNGAEASLRTALVLMSVESVVVVALSATILWVRSGVPGGITFEPFDPAAAQGGVGGFWRAMIIGVLAFAGFDAVSTVAEEAEAPQKHIPTAIFLTIASVTLFWALNAWAYTLGASPDDLRRYTEDGVTAVTPMAALYWGRGSVLIILTAFSGIAAIAVSSVISASRVVFALARHGLLPPALAYVHPRSGVPSRAMALVHAVMLACGVGTVLVTPNGVTGFVWWSNAMVFFFTITFMGVNTANILYFRRRARARFRLLPNLVVPLLGLAMNAYLIYAAFFVALWQQGLAGKSVLLFCLALFAVLASMPVAARLFRPERLAGPAPISALAAD